jgi:hypothetical protein
MDFIGSLVTNNSHLFYDTTLNYQFNIVEFYLHIDYFFKVQNESLVSAKTLDDMNLLPLSTSSLS